MITDERPPTQPTWTQPGAAPRWRGSDSPLRRFLGGSPIAVALKLVLISLLVGMVMMWLNVRPGEVFRAISDMINHVMALGLDGLREFGTYIAAGAAIVLPLWLLSRILSYRSPR